MVAGWRYALLLLVLVVEHLLKAVLADMIGLEASTMYGVEKGLL
jgi:hypothetical protein